MTHNSLRSGLVFPHVFKFGESNDVSVGCCKCWQLPALVSQVLEPNKRNMFTGEEEPVGGRGY